MPDSVAEALLGTLAIVLFAVGFGSPGMRRNPWASAWAAAWAFLLLAGFFTTLDERVPELRPVTSFVATLFPFWMLAGAFGYSGRPLPRALAFAGIGLALLRASLSKLGGDALEWSALVIEPTVMFAAAWVVYSGGAWRNRGPMDALIAPGLFLLGGVEILDEAMGLGGSNEIPWIAWIVVSLPLAAAQLQALPAEIARSWRLAEATLNESEETLRRAQRIAGIGSWSWDGPAEALLWSEENYRIFGITQGPVTNESFLERVHPDDRDPLVRTVTEAVRTGGHSEMEFRVQLPDGEERSIQGRIEAQLDEDGNLTRIFGTNYDVTEMRRTQEALRASEEQLEAILTSASGTLLLLFDRDGKIVSVYGPPPDPPIGLPREKVIGLHWSHLVGDESAVDQLRVVDEVFETGEVRKLRLSVPLPSGDRWYEAWVSPLQRTGAAPDRVLVIARDVTEQVRAERERKVLEAQLHQTQKLESLGVLAGGVAHDFNNMLVGIRGNAELALSRIDAESETAERLRDIEIASDQAALLTQQLLAYAGRTQASTETFDLSALVRGSLPLLRTSVPRSVELRIEAVADEAWLQGDTAQVRQVLMNLVSNAAEALEGRKGRVSVRVRTAGLGSAHLARCQVDETEGPGEFVYLEVADPGSGITAEVLPRIFDPFFTTKFQGRGLGLASVLGIVRSHRGAIEIESKEDEGSTFRLWFPRATAPRRRDAPSAPREDQRSGGLVLVVDDEQLVRRVAVLALEAEGFEVVSASSGAAALEIFRERSDDVAVALVDLTMPDIDGIETFEGLRSLRGDLPVVFMSGHSDSDLERRLRNQRGVDRIAKPFNIAGLGDKIRQVRSEPESEES